MEGFEVVNNRDVGGFGVESSIAHLIRIVLHWEICVYFDVGKQ